MLLRSFQYLCGFTALSTHIAAVAITATSYRFVDFADKISAIFVIAPVTLIYATSFIKYVISDINNQYVQERHVIIRPEAGIALYVAVLAFCCSLLFVVIQFTFFEVYKANEFKMWIGACDTAFGTLIGIVFGWLFGATSGVDVPVIRGPAPEVAKPAPTAIDQVKPD